MQSSTLSFGPWGFSFDDRCWERITLFFRFHGSYQTNLDGSTRTWPGTGKGDHPRGSNAIEGVHSHDTMDPGTQRGWGQRNHRHVRQVGSGRLHGPNGQGLPQGGQPCPSCKKDCEGQDEEHQELDPATR